MLVVDDFSAWRSYVLEKLREKRGLLVVGIVSDGLEAVLKAEELRPDLILMDVGLAKLSGISATRRICKAVPESKILFVSQESDLDVAREALSAGGDGYVVKSDAESELLAAVESVMLGKKFVSSRLAGSGVGNDVDSHASGQSRGEKPIAAEPSPSKKCGRSHEVLFYDEDEILVDGFARFASAALKAGNPAIVVATKPHRDSLLQILQARGLDIHAEIVQGRYIALDPADTLASFMSNDLPDPVRFLNVVGDLIATATRAAKGEHPRVSACEECSPLLWVQGMVDAAIRLEKLWDNIALTYDVDILCGYPSGSFRSEEGQGGFRRICEGHSAVASRVK